MSNIKKFFFSMKLISTLPSWWWTFIYSFEIHLYNTPALTLSLARQIKEDDDEFFATEKCEKLAGAISSLFFALGSFEIKFAICSSAIF